MEKHSASSRDINHFQQCWDLGYRMLLPVVPPDGGTPNAGKQPGVRSSDGVWHGRGYQEFTASLDVIGEWDAWGASVGLSCSGTGLCGIDIDTLSLKYAAEISELAQEMLGWAPMRIGRAPKVLLPYRCPSKLGYAWAKFRDGFERADDRSPGLVECLAGDGKWFVAQGIHPQTQEPYDWPDGMPPFAELTEITIEKRDAFFEELRRRLPAALRVIQGGLGQARSPEELRGDLDAITEAMRAIPNDPASVPYKLWCDMAAALRGAVDFADGLELFEEWSEQAGFSPGSPRYESPRRVFASLDPPFRLGADYIYHRAEKAGWDGRAGRADWASKWDHLIGMEIPPEDIPYELIFGKDAGSESDETRISATLWDYADPRSIPPRDFLYGTHIVRRFASMTVAPSKVGKSSLATVDVLAMVTGRTLLPRMKPKRALRVWYINGEDPLEELQRRLAAAMLRYGLSAGDIGDRLLVDSGRSLRLVTAVEDKNGLRLLQPVIDGLIAELRRLSVDVLVIDPFVSSHQVNENDNSSIDAVMGEWIMTADAAGCAIEFIHHARKAGVGSDPDASIDAARGATSLVAKMRSVRALAKMTKAQGKQLGLTTTYRSLFRITDAASNLAPWVDDETEWFRLENVDLGNGPGDGPERWLEGDHVAVAVPWSAGAGDVEHSLSEVLRALGLEAWREDAQARDEWIGNPVAMALRLDLSEPDDKATVKRLIGKWVKDGVLERVKKQDKKRNTRWYVRAKSVFD